VRKVRSTSQQLNGLIFQRVIETAELIESRSTNLLGLCITLRTAGCSFVSIEEAESPSIDSSSTKFSKRSSLE